MKTSTPTETLVMRSLKIWGDGFEKQLMSLRSDLEKRFEQFKVLLPSSEDVVTFAQQLQTLSTRLNTLEKSLATELKNLQGTYRQDMTGLAKPLNALTNALPELTTQLQDHEKRLQQLGSPPPR